MATPKITIEIDGKNEITNEFYTEDLTIIEKAEITPNILDTDGQVELNVTSVTPVNRIIIDAPVYSNTNLFVNTLRLIINDTINPIYNIDLPISGYQILSFPDSFGQYITNVQINTDSTATAQTIKSRIYSL